MARVLVGTAALATAGRALANTAGEPQGGCGDCQFYTPTAGAKTGTCAFAGKTVSADDGCGAFKPATAGTTVGVAGAAR
jgi:hypothetical protein